MISTLHIENFRNLKSLSLNSLGRLNLITGKNNTGKSSILEAILIFATQGDLNQIKQLLISRGEYLENVEAKFKAMASFFPNREISFEPNFRINLIATNNEENIEIKLGFVKYYIDFETNKINVNLANDSNNSNLDLKIGFQTLINNNSKLEAFNNAFFEFNANNVENHSNIQFIGTRNIDRNINATLWDNITLTDKENFVIDALKIIEPSLQKIAFVEESKNERKAVIKLSESSKILPIGSMGDGINRILTIILALVNAENGYLLIDEFENGLHFSVQEKLWKIIYDLSSKLNVQVFSTTHSEDCIRGFQEIANEKSTDFVGKLIRLDKIEDKITQVEFSLEELKIAENQNIELR